MERLKRIMKENFKDCLKTIAIAYPLTLIMYMNTINQISWNGLALWQVVICYFIAIAIRTILCIFIIFIVLVATDMLYSKKENIRR